MTDTGALTDTQRRFLAAVVERLPRERVRELYLFAPLRQGGIETGVAVLAADLEVAPTEDVPAEPAAEPSVAVDGAACEPVAAEDAREAVLAAEADMLPDVAPAALPPATRFTVFMARYRLQLKGPDRGKWEVELREEADAPLVTVDAVVRGVQRRSGEHAEVERLTPEELDLALSETPWRPTR